MHIRRLTPIAVVTLLVVAACGGAAPGGGGAGAVSGDAARNAVASASGVTLATMDIGSVPDLPAEVVTPLRDAGVTSVHTNIATAPADRQTIIVFPLSGAERVAAVAAAVESAFGDLPNVRVISHKNIVVLYGAEPAADKGAAVESAVKAL